jgi:hypothetical protein
VLIYPFFELTILLSKKVPHRSLLLHFFRLSKYEKPLSLPSLGLLTYIEGRYHCVFCYPRLHTCIFGLMSAPCCSQLNHLKHALYASPIALCLCVLTPLVPGGIFLECPFFEHQSCPCASNLYVCDTHSSFVT